MLAIVLFCITEDYYAFPWSFLTSVNVSFTFYVTKCYMNNIIIITNLFHATNVQLFYKTHFFKTFLCNLSFSLQIF